MKDPFSLKILTAATMGMNITDENVIIQPEVYKN